MTSKMDYVKKRIIISMGAIVLLIITLVGITYAYFTAKVKGNTNEKSVSVNAGMLRLTYGDGNSNIKAEKIIPGTTIVEKTFSVKNTGTNIVENYDVYLENVINELKYYEDLIYTLTCVSDDEDNNACNGSQGVFPKSQQVLVTNTIDVNVTHEYKLVITYKETNLDQSDDMNKLIDAKINIKDDNSNIKTLKIYGNSIQDSIPSPTNKVEIKSLGNNSKNMINYNKSTNNTTYGITYTNNGDGTYTANGTLNYTLSTYSIKNTIDLTSIEKNVEYYASSGADLNNSDRRYYLFAIIKNTENDSQRYYSSHSNKTFVLSDEEEITALEIRIYAPTSEFFTVNDVIFKPIICKASEYVGFEPYDIYRIPLTVNTNTINVYVNEPLRKIENYIDYIDYENKHIVRNIKEIVLDGTEDWEYQNGVFILNTTDIKKDDENIVVLSNSYVGVISKNIDGMENNTIMKTSDNNIAIKDTRFTSIEDFKSNLSSNNIVINYVLENSNYESFVDAHIEVFDDETIKSCSDNGVCASNIEIEYNS